MHVMKTDLEFCQMYCKLLRHGATVLCCVVILVYMQCLQMSLCFIVTTVCDMTLAIS